MATSLRSAARNDESIWKFGRLSVWELGRNVVLAALEHDILERASGLAFDFLFALIPLLVSLLALLRLFTSRSMQLQNTLLTFFADFLPALAFQLLSNTTRVLATNPSGEELVIGFLAALWFASGGVSLMISSLNVVYGVKAPLIVDFVENPPGAAPNGEQIRTTFCTIRYDFVLQPLAQAAAAA